MVHCPVCGGSREGGGLGVGGLWGWEAAVLFRYSRPPSTKSFPNLFITSPHGSRTGRREGNSRGCWLERIFLFLWNTVHSGSYNRLTETDICLLILVHFTWVSEKGKFRVLWKPAMITVKKIHGGRLLSLQHPQLVSGPQCLVKGNVKKYSLQQMAKGCSDPWNASAAKFLFMNIIWMEFQFYRHWLGCLSDVSLHDVQAEAASLFLQDFKKIKTIF